ncbi:MAG: sialate O-acetylesterase, partial [Bacteroidetes bacterium]|nr:sialate O-acetylesterase [Bacteroidota bacterium]
MKRSLSVLTLFTLFVFSLTISLKAEVKLPTIFGDNMVLQQQTDAAIWG